MPASTGRREAILRAATRLWGHNGYADLTLRRVAEEGRVALALIDHHFGGKPVLFREATRPLRQVFEDAVAQFDGESAVLDAWPDSAVDLLMQPIEALVRAGPPGRALLKLWQRQINDPTPEVAVPLRLAFRSIETTVARLAANRLARPLAAEGASTAASGDDPLDRLCRFAFGTGVALILHELALEPDEPDGLAVQGMVDQGIEALEPARALVYSVFAPGFSRLAPQR